MTKRERQELGGQLFLLRWKKQLSQEEAATTVGIPCKEYMRTLAAFLDSPYTLQAEILSREPLD